MRFGSAGNQMNLPARYAEGRDQQFDHGGVGLPAFWSGRYADFERIAYPTGNAIMRSFGHDLDAQPG